MEGTVALHLTSSFIVISPSKSLRQKASTIFWLGSHHLDWCPICQILIKIGRICISSLRDGMGVQARRVDGMTGRFDNTWGVVKESGESSVSFFVAPSALIVYLTFCSFCFSA